MSHFIFVAWLSVLGAVSGALAVRFEPDPFADAKNVPAEVTAYFSFVECEGAIERLRQSPTGEGLQIFLTRTGPGREVAAYLNEAGVDPGDLLGQLAKQSLTLVLIESEGPDHCGNCKKRGATENEDGKTSAHSESKHPWILMARMTPAEYKQLHHRLDSRVGEWVGGIPISKLKGNEISLAFKNDRVYLADVAAQPVLVKMLHGLPEAETLAQCPEFAGAAKMGTGEIAFFSRRPGQSRTKITIGVGQLHETGMTLRLRTQKPPRSPESPRMDRPEPRAMDVALMATVDDGVALVKIERMRPRRLNRSSRNHVEIFPVPNPEHADNDVAEKIGPTLFTVMRTVERRDPAGLVVWIEPQISVGVELRHPVSGTAALDRFMNEQIKRLAEWRQIEMPDMAHALRMSDPGLVRFVMLNKHSMSMDRFGLEGRWPREWAWSTTTGKQGAWWVCSTDQSMLHDLDTALMQHEPKRTDDSLVEQGVLRGRPISEMLSTWPGVNADSDDCMAAGLFAWKELLRSVRTVGWSSTRPEPGVRETQVEIRWD